MKATEMSYNVEHFLLLHYAKIIRSAVDAIENNK